MEGRETRYHEDQVGPIGRLRIMTCFPFVCTPVLTEVSVNG